MLPNDDCFFRILYVDDNLAIREAFKTGLVIHGFEVVTASHGMDALRQYKAQAGRFGTVVTDHDMPQMNGLELARSLREMGYEGRIVIASGHLRPEDLRAYQPHQISGFFHKPFETRLLAAMLLRNE